MLGRQKKRTKTGRKLLFWGAAIAGGMYFFDPQMGRTRRAKLQDQIDSFLNRKTTEMQQKASYVAQQSYGVVRETAEAVTPDSPPASDETLKEKIESEVLRGDDFPKGRINIGVVGGVVTLRGELDDDARINELEQKVRKISGVVDVENLLHLPTEPPPNKADALRTSRNAETKGSS